MMNRIKAAWRALLGRQAIKEVRDVTLDEIPPDQRQLIFEAMERLASQVRKGLFFEYDTPCSSSNSPHGYHCACWHRGVDNCCYCRADVPEEREAIRRS